MRECASSSRSRFQPICRFTLSIHLDQRVLLFSLAVAVFSVFLLGLIPAMQTTRVNLADAMKTGDAAASVKTRLWGRRVLVGAQVAVSLVLLTVSGFHLPRLSLRAEYEQGFPDRSPADDELRSELDAL